jgi:hypothetical protein
MESLVANPRLVNSIRKQLRGATIGSGHVIDNKLAIQLKQSPMSFSGIGRPSERIYTMPRGGE